MTDTTPFGEEAEVPEGFIDPVENLEVPFVVPFEGDDPVPSAARIENVEGPDAPETEAAETPHFTEADL